MSKNIIGIVPELLVIDENTVLKDKCVIIEDGKIRKIDDSTRLRDYGPEFVFNSDHMAAIPSLVNSHTHSSERLLSGVGDGLPLLEWLKQVVWPGGAKLRARDANSIAKLFAMELMSSGVGLFNDLFVSLNNELFLDDLASAISEVGLKACLARGVHEQSGYGEFELEDGIRAARKWHGDKKIKIFLSPVLIMVNSEEMLKRIRETASSENLRIHIHVAETQEEYKWVREQKNASSVEYLERIGFLGTDVVAAHLIWLGANDLGILKKRGVSGVHNPLSNSRLGSGIANVRGMLSSGIPLGLGTDGSASSDNQDIFAAMRMAALLHRARLCDPGAISAKEVFAMTTRNGYRILGFEGGGEIREGNPADIAVINLNHPSLYPPNDLVNQLVLSSHPGVVRSLFVDGKLLYDSGNFLTIDQHEVYSEIAEIQHRISTTSYER